MRFAPALALVVLVSGVVRADDIATLPLGDPSRAYLLAAGSAGEVVDCRGSGGGGATEFDALVQDLAAADVILIGEHHTNLAGHQFQWRLFDAIAASAPPSPFVLGMEFFEVSDDAALARFTAGSLTLDEMLDETGWYGGGTNYNFEYYRPLAETARKHGFAIRGINVPREIVRAVSRGGLDSLSEKDRTLIGDLGAPDDRHRFLVNQMMDGLGAAMPQAFDGMYRGQTVWDAAMARSILRARAESGGGANPPKVVVIVGSGHVAHGLGIPARLREAAPDLSIRIVAPVQARRPDPDQPVHPGFEPKESAIFSRGYADWVYVLPDDGGEEAYPRLGLRLEHPTGAASPTSLPLNVASVTPGSIADRSGLKKGDRLVAINGEQIVSLPHAARLLAALRWDQRARFDVLRSAPPASDGGGDLMIPVLVVPPIDGELDWLRSRAESSILDDFDPRSTRGYLEDPKHKPPFPHARLVRFRDLEVRIDVMDGSRVMETWKLDDAGRPTLGLLASPGADGAVRVELDRDSLGGGAVTAERRFGPEGNEIVAPARP